MSGYEHLIRLEIASIGSLESAAHHEADPGYTILFRETKTGKQASVEQLNTLLRIAGRTEIEGGGLIEPVIRLQTLALERANTTAMLQALSLVQETLTAQYRKLAPTLRGLERRAIDRIVRRSSMQWMIILAHIARRTDGESRASDVLPHPLSAYFASEEDRVCMRCLLDRPGTAAPLIKDDPYTYVCAACHDEVLMDVPPDLKSQIARWSDQDERDRSIHRALSRPEKLRAIKEVHAKLAGLRPERAARASASRAEAAATVRARTRREAPPSDISIARDNGSDEEVAYTDLLFDFRSVRHNW